MEEKKGSHLMSMEDMSTSSDAELAEAMRSSNAAAFKTFYYLQNSQRISYKKYLRVYGRHAKKLTSQNPLKPISTV